MNARKLNLERTDLFEINLEEMRNLDTFCDIKKYI